MIKKFLALNLVLLAITVTLHAQAEDGDFPLDQEAAVAVPEVIDTLRQAAPVRQGVTRRRRASETEKIEESSHLSVKQQAFNEKLKQDTRNAPWKRVIYREVHLDSANNAVLYYPPRPTSADRNLFTILFGLVNQGAIKAYEYTDGLEVFDSRTEIKFGEFLDRFGIYATKEEGEGPSSYKVSDADIPSDLVKAYYIKEEYYLDPINSTTDKRVLAICPIFFDEMNEGETLRFPLFWVRYDDIRPYLNEKTIMVSDRNNAESFTLDGFFRLGLYEGTIYKTLNLRGLTLAQYCPTPDSLRAEQMRIEGELKSFEQSLWSRAARESTASEAKAEAEADPDNLTSSSEKASEAKTARARRNELRKNSTPKAPKAQKVKSKKTSGGAKGGRSARSRF